jgi:hypothetical protein
MDDPAVLEPLNERGSLLIGGRDLDPRIDRFPDLDIRTPGTVPRYDQIYHPREWEMTAVNPIVPPLSERAIEAARRVSGPAFRKLSPGARRRARAATRRLRR